MVSNCNLYRYVFGRDDLSIGSRVLWCYLCTQVSLDVAGAGKDLAEVLTARSGEVYLEGVSYDEIPSKLQMSRYRYKVAMSELASKGIYDDDLLYFPVAMLDAGFFDLKSKAGMTPWDYVLYSWIMDRIEYGGGNMTDVTNGAIAAGLGISEDSVKQRKKGLYLRGCLKVVRRGSVVYCADGDALARDGVPRPPKVSSRKKERMHTNLDRF